MHTAVVNDTTLAYTDDGPRDAPAILFSHSLFFDSSMFEAQRRALSDEFRVVCPDHRGQGSSAPADRDALDMDLLAQDAAALIEHLDLAPCHVVGNSMGGFVALRLAARRPDLVASCITLGSSGEEEHKLAEFEPLVEDIAQRGTEPHLDVLMHIMFSDTFLADEAPGRSGQRERWRAHMAGLGAAVAPAARGFIHRTGVLAEVGEIRVPVLAVAGGEDHAYEVERSQAIADAAPDGRLEVLQRAGHSVAVEEPEAVSRLVAEHVRAVARAAPAA